MGIFHSSIYLRGDQDDYDCYSDLLHGDGKGLVGGNMFPPRFRSVEISVTHPYIAIRGRCGGGNRPQFQKQISAVEKAHNFVESFDDSRDSTFMHFVFNFGKSVKKVQLWIKFIEKWNSCIQFSRHDRRNTNSIHPPPPKLLSDTGKTIFFFFFFCHFFCVCCMNR